MMATNSKERERAEARLAAWRKKTHRVKTEQQAAEEVVRQKTERLKSLRLAKEATEATDMKKARPDKHE
jgi:hypothetical protein